MSKIDELIKELCPNGVEYKTTADVKIDSFWLMPATPNYVMSGVPYITSKNIKNNRIDFDDVKYITQKDYINISTNRSVQKNDLLITMIGTIGEAAFVGDFTEFYGQNLYLVRLNENIIDRKYYYYFLTSPRVKDGLVSKKNASSQGYIKAGSIENLKLPIPPLPIQREIVRILDSFTELTEELTEELTKELTKRNKQYEFYRDELLNFDNEVEFKSFRELFDVRNGLNKGKEFFGHGSPIINFTDVYTNRWLVKDSFIGTVEVTPDEIERYSAKKGDVFFTRTSETKEDIGMASTLIEDVENCVFSGFVLRARPKTDLLLPKFCAYYFSSTTVRNTIVRYASFTTRATTTGDKLSKILVPILSKEKQEKIVYVLDNFDAICSDLNIGLPAEIEARQKQYEYYRDMLLTFAEKGEIIPDRQTDRQTDKQ